MENICEGLLSLVGIDSVVIPRKFLDELRRLPDNTLSAGKAVADVRSNVT